MKKIILGMVCSFCILLLAACGSDDVQTSNVSDSSLIPVDKEILEEPDEMSSDDDGSDEKSKSDNDSDTTETVVVTTNGCTYCVPASWKIDNEEDESTKFLVDENETNIVLVQVKEIPLILKIDTGSGDAILTKEDVPSYFLLVDEDELTSAEWKDDLEFDYYDAYFNMSDGRVGRTIVIPINETEAGFSITVLVDDETYLDDIDICISSLTLSSKAEDEDRLTDTETYYNLCMTLTKNDCTKDSLGLYSYNGITFLSDDSEWMDNPLNDDGSINASSFYLKLQNCLANFSIGNSWTSYAEHIIGYTPDSRDEFAPYVEEYLTYMTDSWFGNSMVEKFQTMESVDVVQDDKNYTCTISDVTACADELYISEEMLGYIMGALNDCGATITFDGSSCVIEYYDWSTSD